MPSSLGRSKVACFSNDYNLVEATAHGVLVQAGQPLPGPSPKGEGRRDFFVRNLKETI